MKRSVFLRGFAAVPPYDSVNDFMSISLLATFPQPVPVHPSLPVKTLQLQELIDCARKSPKPLNYGSGGNGSSQRVMIMNRATNKKQVLMLFRTASLSLAHAHERARGSRSGRR